MVKIISIWYHKLESHYGINDSPYSERKPDTYFIKETINNGLESKVIKMLEEKDLLKRGIIVQLSYSNDEEKEKVTKLGQIMQKINPKVKITKE
ncbi:MAG: hypothetical protein ABIH25_00075 [Candidatus Woesearchaeota archaeon]